ncbi:MAG: DUF3137 domain-containing protein [Cyanobacteria bacterium J06629_2]
MTQPPSLQEIDRLYIQGDRYLHQDKCAEAIAIFEPLLETVDPNNRLYFDLQRNLIKAYQQNQELDRAIALCQSVAASEVAARSLWGQSFLATLSPEFPAPVVSQTEDSIAETQAESDRQSRIKPKTLAQFKHYCQQHLLGELKALERKRKYTLRTIFGSGIICLIIAWCISQGLSDWTRNSNSIWLYLTCLSMPFSVWIVFCRGCIHTYKIGFKRNIIEQIVDFIGDRDWLNYAAHLMIENKRQTIVALTRSQILRDELEEPDYLEQEDCVYGTIGNTDIFFAEIIAENRKGGHFDEYAREVYRSKSTLFRGLFFEARFAKNFVSRTFVMPNDLQHRLTPLNSWRGETINLEDPEFDRLFRVYGDSQVESRYLLSTNLMSRLVKFHHKAGRKVYLSLIDGFLYIAIPYRHNLFEPRLFKSMMSFAPLKEYFQDLQLMIGIVEDLNLNRRIWKQ